MALVVSFKILKDRRMWAKTNLPDPLKVTVHSGQSETIWNIGYYIFLGATLTYPNFSFTHPPITYHPIPDTYLYNNKRIPPMTRNYHRLWQRPHRPHRDSPYPDVPDIPDVPDVPEEHVHLYTFQSDFYPEEFEDFDHPYYPETPDQNETPSNPMFDHGVTSEYESWDEYDHQYRVTSADVDGPHDERELSADESGPEPSDLNDSFDHGYNHDFDPREPSVEQQSSTDYYYNDHSDSDYYHDDEDQFYPEDILINEFNRLDLEPGQDHEDYPNYGHGVVYPPDHGHSANKPTFFHADSNQEFHHDCHICADYMEDFYKRSYHDGTDSYSDNE